MSVRSNKIKLALTGHSTAPKLLTALKLAYGLSRDWNRVISIGCSARDAQFQHLGAYHTLHIDTDATPSRYTELLNLATGCGKDVLILSTLSNEWCRGVQDHLDSSCFQDVLRAHRTLFQWMRHAPVHIICLIDSRTIFLQRDEEGRRKLRQEQLVQQPGVEDHFTSVLHLDRRGNASVRTDVTGTFPTGAPFSITFDSDTLLFDWCRRVEPEDSSRMQERVNACTSIHELHQLLFTVECDDTEALNALTRRRMELEATERVAGHEPQLTFVEGGLL